MQMKTIKHFIYGFGLLLTSVLVSCSDSEENMPVPEGDNNTCSLTIQLGAEGATETRVGGDDKAKTGEFINTLWVFVVDAESKSIEAKFKLLDGKRTSIENATGGGNILQWMRTVEGVPTGEKIIYAFANMDNVSTTETSPQQMGTLLDGYYANGGTIDVDNLVISDPATNINITEGKYIPMSLKESVTITGDQTIYVELIRLVGRVDVTIGNGKDESIFVKEMTMEKFCNQVSLIKDASVSIPAASETRTIPLSETITAGNSSSPFSFYVNETGSDDYTVTLTATTGSSTTEDIYCGVLTLQDADKTGIPRNHYLPLSLNIGESEFIIEIYAAPIGGYPRNVITYGDLTNPAATNSVDVPEGCSLRVKDASTSQYYNLSIPTNIPSGVIKIGTDPQWAHITALQASGSVAIIADGTLIPLNIVPLTDYALTGSLGWEPIPQGVLMMK